MKKIIILIAMIAFALPVMSQEDNEMNQDSKRPAAKGPIKMMWEKSDVDKDGKISREEWAKHHEEMFKEIDKNADGFIDQTEMASHHMMMAEKHGKNMHNKDCTYCKMKHKKNEKKDQAKKKKKIAEDEDN